MEHPSSPSLMAFKERSPSLRSVASNSSVASTGSLTRRPRTRARSRTLTGADSNPMFQPAADEKFPFGTVVAEPQAEVEPVQRTSSSSMADTRGQQPQHPFIYPTPRPNPRDSFLSDFSGVSSSLYPPSTSTASGTESPPSPRSVLSPDGDYDVPVMDDMQEYDGDDVSYRLRLLVKNNYFLPPAHTKPSVSDLAPSPTVPSRKPSSPTFLDIFRGRAKSKPPTPVNGVPPPDILGPALRTAADQNNFAPRSPSYAPPPPTGQDRSGRVMVVREKMPDLVGAAKQAEQDMKSRGGTSSRRGIQDQVDDVIDPTDAVDLPLPSAKYPFAVQASAMHGLGVHDSLGAALLADRLPPPTSPGPSTLDPRDDWRVQLLRAAVGHSFDNLQESTPTSHLSVATRSPSPPQIGQRIISNPININGGIDAAMSRPHRSRGMSSPPTPTEPQHASYLPLRSESPAAPLTALSPPPRRIINPLYSLSQTDLAGSSQQNGPPSAFRRAPTAPSVIRKSISSPRLGYSRLTPPPIPSSWQSKHSSTEHLTSSYETTRERLAESAHTGSIYSEYEVDISRSSTTLSYYSQASPTASAFQDALNGRPESRLSRVLSVRTSHDHDTRTETLSPPPLAMSPPPPRPSISISPTPLAPPPRVSSLPSTNLPRRFLQPLPSSEREPRISLELMEPGPSTPPYPTSEYHTGPPLSLRIPTGDIPLAIHSAPPPASPMAFFDSIQSQPNAMDDLDSSDEESEDGEEEEEGDEDEDGEEDDLDDHEHDEEARLSYAYESGHTDGDAAPTLSDTEPVQTLSQRSSLMRLGNHSVPYVTPSMPFGVTDPRQPIGYVPLPEPRAPFFSDRISERNVGGNSFDFYKYAQNHPVSSDSGDAPAPSMKRRPATADQQQVRHRASFQRLDGLLIQHMEAEKDRLKRIASGVHSSPGGAAS